MSLWEERAARNEAMFREVNESVRGVSDPEASAEFVCECSREDCLAHIALTLEGYERVRADARAFLVVPGHEDNATERAVGGGDGYLIVEKTGTAGRIADRTDPRS